MPVYYGTDAPEYFVVTETYEGSVVYAAGGNDTIEGGLLGDTLYGGEGNDVISGRENDDVLVGGAGRDLLGGYQGSDLLIGGEGDDVFSDNLEEWDDLGGSSHDSMIGGAGDDSFWIEFDQQQYVQIAGGDGVDTARFSERYDDPWSLDNKLEVTGTAGVWRAGEEVRTSFVGVERFVFRSGDGDDELASGAGDDVLVGGGGDDLLIGRGGNDWLQDGDGSDTLSGGSGADTLWSGASGDGIDLLLGGDGDDVLISRNGALVGGDGFDIADFSVFSAGPAVSVDLAVTAYQTVAAGAGQVRFQEVEGVIGSSEADTLLGSAGANRLDGGSGRDQLVGRDGDDTLLGGATNDTLSGGPGDDVLDGGANVDTATYADAAAGVQVRLGVAGAQDTGGGGIDSLISIERLIGSAFADRLTGDDGANILNGLAGDDVLLGGAGKDGLNGAAGVDLASYLGASGGVTVTLMIDDYQDTGGAGSDRLVSIENLRGSGFADLLTGSTGANMLNGAEGDDTLRGGDGTDTLIGGDGDDTLLGGDGDDVLRGNAGTNTIEGGAGADRIVGLTGASDRYVYRSVADSTATRRDTIFGFAEGDDKLIDLSAIDAIAGGGDDAFTLVSDFTGRAGELRVVSGGSSLFRVEGDVDGDGLADLAIAVSGAGFDAGNNLLL